MLLKEQNRDSSIRDVNTLWYCVLVQSFHRPEGACEFIRKKLVIKELTELSNRPNIDNMSFWAEKICISSDTVIKRLKFLTF